jgi:hypothetical protein
MNTIRMFELASFLRTVNPVKFNLRTWRSYRGTIIPQPNSWGERAKAEYSRKLNDTRSNEALLDPDCGTTGCAIGWACAMPFFIKEGFVWDLERHGPSFGNLTDWEAINAFFDIPARLSERLFLDMYYDTNSAGPANVADKIENFIRQYSHSGKIQINNFSC